MNKFKIRFHLAKGKNYLKWQVKYPTGGVRYYSPDEVTLIMHGILLRNQKGTATKIHDGAHKTVCAWVEADFVEVLKRPSEPSVNCEKVGYNPRVTPNWTFRDENVDSKWYPIIYSCGKTLYK